ncbi:MAG: prolipoprotein diacylglyceryl transferase [Streptosporangiaceae bacterium]
MASHAPAPPLSFLPSPSVDGFHAGPLFVHFYGLMYVVGIALAIYITRRRWRAAGGDPGLVADVATWAVPAGIIGGRVYFDITTPDQIPHVWYGVFAVWTGGLGIWGGVAFGAAAGIWRVRRTGASAGAFGNAIAPALLVAQAVGRIGNYFNQELFGKPSGLPWALEISHAHRVSSGLPAQYLADRTFQPTFLYELIWDLALAAALVWLGHHRKIRPWGLFALYIAGYSAFRILEESLRIDTSEHFLGLRLNFYVATIGTIAGLAWFTAIQRRAARAEPPDGPGPAHDSAGGDEPAEAGDATAGAGAPAGSESDQDRDSTAVQSGPAAE